MEFVLLESCCWCLWILSSDYSAKLDSKMFSVHMYWNTQSNSFLTFLFDLYKIYYDLFILFYKFHYLVYIINLINCIYFIEDYVISFLFILFTDIKPQVLVHSAIIRLPPDHHQENSQSLHMWGSEFHNMGDYLFIYVLWRWSLVNNSGWVS